MFILLLLFSTLQKNSGTALLLLFFIIGQLQTQEALTKETSDLLVKCNQGVVTDTDQIALIMMKLQLEKKK